MTVVKNRMTMFSGQLPMYGTVTGFVIDYAYDLCAQFDLDGHVVEGGSRTCRVAEPEWSLGHGKSLTSVLKV